MEDAHITMHEISDELRHLALFGVFDGHGGREVALFCERHFGEALRLKIADCVPAQLSFGAPGQAAAPPEALDGSEAAQAGATYTAGPTVIGKAMGETFLRMDEMLFLPETDEELQALKTGGKQEMAASQSAPNGNPNIAQMQARLQSAIASDMNRARSTGGLTSEEAGRLAIKMSYAKRLEGMRSQDALGHNFDRAADNVGCTAVCTVLAPNHIIVANAGDSRAVLCRNGKPVPLSEDHKPNAEDETRRIESAGGFIKEVRVKDANGGEHITYRVNGVLSLSRAIGDLRFKGIAGLSPSEQVITCVPDIKIEPRTPEDEFIILACDGVWDVKSNAEVVAFVRSRLRRGEPVQQVMEALLDACLAKDPRKTTGIGGDNMTCIVVVLPGLNTAEDGIGDDLQDGPGRDRFHAIRCSQGMRCFKSIF